MSPPNTSALRYYLAIIRRRWIVITVAVLVPLIIGIVLYVITPKTYQGTAEVVINRQSLSDELNGTPDPVAESSDFVDIVQTDADTARSIEVATRVVRAVPDSHLTASRFLGMSAVTAAPNADLLTFTAQSRDAGLAVHLAGAYAKAYTAYSLQQSTSAFNAASSQLSQRIAAAQAARNADLVTSLEAKAESLKTLAALQTANTFVVMPSDTASVASPKKSSDIGLFLVIGIVLAAALVALLEGLDTKARSPDEVGDLLRVPFLGRLVPPPSGFQRRAIAVDRPQDPVVEGFRILRANLELHAETEDAKVYMVTSSVESEGKSLTIANLAVVAARAGKKVALVDLDLRRPTQNLIFGTEGRSPGLTDVLRGEVSLENALVPIALTSPEGAELETSSGSLSVLRSGPIPADPGDIVVSEELAVLVGHLRDTYDLVFVDTPPVLRTGDALAVSRSCDAIFVVTRLPIVTRPMLHDLARTIVASPTPVIGFVVTGQASVTEDAYGYGYGAAYGYGYGYAQTVDEIPSAKVDH